MEVNIKLRLWKRRRRPIGEVQGRRGSLLEPLRKARGFAWQYRLEGSIALWLSGGVLTGEACQCHQLQLPAMLIDLVLPINGICQNFIGH